MCYQRTKSLRDSPLRGGKSREAVASREESDSGRQGHRDQQAYCCNAQRSIKRIKLTYRQSLMRGWPAAGMTIIGLDE